MTSIENPSRRRLFKGRFKQESVLRLPWVISEDHFVEHCNQCLDCIDACPTQIIIEHNDGLPRIDFSIGECTFCNKCIESCSKPLFHEQSFISEKATTKKLTPWPASLSISKQCLAKNNIYCQSCRDVCETNAIVFSYKNTSVPSPTIKLNDCVQCGACIDICPQDALSFTLNNESHHD